MSNIVEETINQLTNFNKLEEMSVRVGVITPKNYLVYVNTDDSGNIPHFHVVDNNTTGDEFHTCIMIEESRYFTHNSKVDKLTRGKDRKNLDKFLRQKFSNSKFNGTNWEYIVMIWNMNNSNVVIEDIKQPDYSTIEDYK